GHPFREGPQPRGPSRLTLDGLEARLLRLLCPDESVLLVHDHLSVSDLGRIRKCRLQLLLAHPGGCDATRLVGLRRSLEEPDRTHDAVAGLDDVVALEARQLAQAGHEALVDLLCQLVGATLVDTLVASNSAMHVMLPTVTVQGVRARSSSPPD